MQGLFKRVCAGRLQKTPTAYSVDLSNIVKSMLQVNPK